MPIAIGDQVYPDELSYNASLLGIPLTPEEKTADGLKSQGGTQRPSDTNANPEPSSGTGERYQTWPERLVRGAISAMALPGDILSGKVQPNSPQEIERAADLAGLMVMGPAPVASKLAEGTLGSFAGVRSKTLDKNALAQAQILTANGEHPTSVWQQTGFFQGADGRWRYEIPDNNAQLRMDNFIEVTPQESSGWTTANTNTGPIIVPKSSKQEFNTLEELLKYDGPFEGMKLSDVLDHPELFKAYPSLKGIQIHDMAQGLRNKALAFVDRNGDIHMSPMEPELAKSVLLHEVQHVIQKHEEFARGGNPAQFEHPNITKAQKLYDDAIAQGGDPNSPSLIKAKKILDDNRNQAYQNYLRLAGEVESRNVEARLLLDDAQRKYISPQSTEDHARNEQIVRFYNE